MSNESVVGICLSWHLARFICLVTQHCAVPFSNRFKTHMICVWHWKTNLYGMTQQYVYVYSMHCNMRLSVFFSLSFHFYCLELKIRFFFSDDYDQYFNTEKNIYIYLTCVVIPFRPRFSLSSLLLQNIKKAYTPWSSNTLNGMRFVSPTSRDIDNEWINNDFQNNLDSNLLLSNWYIN